MLVQVGVAVDQSPGWLPTSKYELKATMCPNLSGVQKCSVEPELEVKFPIRVSMWQNRATVFTNSSSSGRGPAALSHSLGTSRTKRIGS